MSTHPLLSLGLRLSQMVSKSCPGAHLGRAPVGASEEQAGQEKLAWSLSGKRFHPSTTKRRSIHCVQVGYAP